jgi:gentisate 1,2-dioxygenase
MGRGDLVLTPPWTWHDHGNESDEPMIWLDGLDLPLVAEVEATFVAPFPRDATWPWSTSTPTPVAR